MKVNKGLGAIIREIVCETGKRVIVSTAPDLDCYRLMVLFFFFCSRKLDYILRGFSIISVYS